MTIRVAIVDDHPLFLEGLRVLLDSTPDLHVVASAADGAGLLAALAELEVDVCVVDLDMPGMDGAELTRQLLAVRPSCGVLVLTMHDDADSVSRALRAGARGYVLKGAAHGAVVRAIRAVAEGDTVLSGAVGAAVRSAATQAAPDPAFPALSAREVEVLHLVARGLPNREIAQALFLSVKTVQNHVSALLAKTGSDSRAQLVVLARDERIDPVR